ncbi:MAG: hypothetical protein KC502_06425 [Myxococcales bacterium]|nr:hypothetical protein [Myxococcales bacterium]
MRRHLQRTGPWIGVTCALILFVGCTGRIELTSAPVKPKAQAATAKGVAPPNTATKVTTMVPGG